MEIRKLDISIKKKVRKFIFKQNKKAANDTKNNADFWKLYKNLTKKGAAKKFKLIDKENKTMENDDKVAE